MNGEKKSCWRRERYCVESARVYSVLSIVVGIVGE